MFVPNEQVRQTLLNLSNYGGTDPDLDREDITMRRDPEEDRYEKADKRAKSLAKKIMGKKFTELMKKKYLRFVIKVKKQKGKIVEKKLYILKDVTMYQLNEKNHKLAKICSLIAGSDQFEVRQFSDYDKLVAYYLWLKHYSKHPIRQLDFNDQFNLMSECDYTLKELIHEINIARYSRR